MNRYLVGSNDCTIQIDADDCEWSANGLVFKRDGMFVAVFINWDFWKLEGKIP